MATLRFMVETPLSPDRVLAAARDFSDRRPDLWPTIDRRVYEVHAEADTWAEVTEGSDVMGGIWARERYEWSDPGLVTARMQDSNVFRAGGSWEMRAHPKENGGSEVEIVWNRHGRGLKGHVLVFILSLVGRKVLAKQLRETLEIVRRQGDMATPS